jgi:hypothetical protein
MAFCSIAAFREGLFKRAAFFTGLVRRHGRSQKTKVRPANTISSLFLLL